MQRIGIFGMLLGLLVLGRDGRCQNARPPAGFCVLELFSSEGCASCPPAELLMKKLAGEFRSRRVYVLCYHVDYFNTETFRDPYSQAACSRRQEAYDRLFHHYVYTPQLVIDGSRQTSGYDAYAAYGAIRKDLSVPHACGLRARAVLQGNQLQVRYSLVHPDPGNTLELALVQAQGPVQHIRYGENSGRALQEARIVRCFTVRQALPGSWSVDLPQDLSTQDLSLMLLEQSGTDMQIEDAGEVPVQPAVAGGVSGTRVKGK